MEHDSISVSWDCKVSCAYRVPKSSPAEDVPERLRISAQRKRVISHKTVLSLQRVRSYIQSKQRLALTSMRLQREHPHKEEATMGPVFVRRRRVFPCPSVRWFSTSRKTLSSRSLFTWCTRTCLLNLSAPLLDHQLLPHHIPLEIVGSRISMFALWTEWTYVAWAVVHQAMADHLILALEALAAF